MKILVLGGSAFVGKHLMLGLAADHEVAALTRGLTPGDWTGVNHITCDRSDPVALRRALGNRHFDAIVDVSCYTGVDCATLVSALETPPNVHILISSAGIYNRRVDRLPFEESSAGGGDLIWGDYGREKWVAERELFQGYGPAVRTIALRPPYIYGPGNNLPRESALWARMASSRPIFVPGNGETLIQMCYIDDLAAIVRAAIAGGLDTGAYNVGEDSFYTFDQYIRLLAQVGSFEPRIEYVVDRRFVARDYFPFRQNNLILSVAKLLSTNPPPFRSLRDGLTLTLGSMDVSRLPAVDLSKAELLLESELPSGA